MIIVFDLDDTLYQEVNFVQGGFKAVAEFLELNFQVPYAESFEFMNERLKKGRNNIFDDLLKEFNLFNKKLVKKCISAYRRHKPAIHLLPEADSVLKMLQEYPIYIVTDGNKLVQKNKLLALGLTNRVKHCFITHNYGLGKAKPSPYCFLKICQKEKVRPEEVVYIGDNPNKDFLNLKPIGFKTVRVLQGHFKGLKKETQYEADYEINSLRELTIEFLQKVFSDRK